MTNVVISSAARTAVGSYGKSLKDVPPTELGAIAATRRDRARAASSPTHVDHVVFGNVIHTAPDDMYMARVVGMKAGIPKETPAYTVNRLCGTGVQAIVSAAQAIQTGEARVALAGGAESMSRGPYWMPDARWGARMGETKMVDPVDGRADRPVPRASSWASPPRTSPSGMSITREEQDAFAVESHRRAEAAQDAGPLRRRDRAGAGQGQARDRRLHARRAHPPRRRRRGDGQAAADLQEGRRDGHRRQRVGHERRRRGARADGRRPAPRELGAPVRARILGYAACGVDPTIMGIGPVPGGPQGARAAPAARSTRSA